MPITLDDVQRLAPDQASLHAAGKLLGAGKWPLRAQDPARSLAWGECQGSGSTPYRVSVTLDDLGYKCSCPSRKFPCKHALAVLWQMVERSGEFAVAPAPDWVEEWLSRRKKRGGGPAETGEAKDIAAALAAPVEEPGRSAEEALRQARRRFEAREASIAAGLDDFEQWVRDVLGEGLGSFPARATERCRQVAARLVDARAAGLAGWIDGWPADLFERPEADREAWLADALGRAVLLVRAYRRQAALPPALREDVRRIVGWTVSREDLLADAGALRVADRWTVLAVRSEVQPDRLVRHETWMRRHGDGTPRWALLIDFAPIAAGAAPPAYRAGEVLSAEMVYYPSAWPLRALLAQRDPTTEGVAAEAFGGALPGIDAAVGAARDALAVHPWLDPVPVLIGGVRLGTVGGRLALGDEAGAVLPVEDEADASRFGLGASGAFTAAALIGRAGVRLLAAETPWGPWYA